MNPARHAIYTGTFPHKRPVVLVVTNLPSNEGYHEGRKRIVEACLLSAKKHAGIDHTFAVWDNGSIPIMREWIADIIAPDVFIQSSNIGKTAATKYAARMFRETVIARSDDDVLYYPGWLAESLKVYNAYPKPSEVSCSPNRMNMTLHSATLRWATNERAFRDGESDRKWDIDHGKSIGYDCEKIATYFSRRSHRMLYNGVYAFAGCCHFQTLMSAELLDTWDFSDNIMRDELRKDQAADEAGVLRLFTAERYARHLGNTLTADDVDELEELGV
jgi:hypothetical protein